MTKDSQVGSASIYEAGDQRNYSRDEQQKAKADARFDEGKKGAHSNLDSKDERSIKNRLASASAEASSTHEGPEKSKDHGKRPSRMETSLLEEPRLMPSCRRRMRR
ncbi:uncharacterized protein LAJ45_01336 [Morchella importuna]|uniref:uncharacterized protein n=1 Tax=Morchella importuna TaxID=1174673 RepID=UPI001E8DA93A|nr:uncharacterized protein LAJ45_01336 [Morchella importuna]KAH8154805.1 hypothetical protein LAJ45_01336 [Morchella importuna]